MNELFGFGMYGSYPAVPGGIPKYADDLSIEATEIAIVKPLVCETRAEGEMFNEGYCEAAKIMAWIEEESR